MTLLGIFVDDLDKHLTGSLRTKEILEFEWLGLQPVTKLAAEIVRRKPAIVALDYRLDEAPEDLGADDVYKGSALAQHLRDGAVSNPSSDFPIVLVSTEDKLEKLYTPDKTAHDLFDRVYRKDNLTSDRSSIRAELIALANGYVELIKRIGKFDPYEVLAADREIEDLNFQELVLAFERSEAPHLISNYVLRQVIDRPGLLFDKYDAAARLGVSPASFVTLVPMLDAAGLTYRGLYSEGWQRWWAGRLLDWAEKLFQARPSSLSASTRSTALSEAMGVQLETARSTWNNSEAELIMFACHCCRNGSEIRHSLSVFSPSTPKYVTRPRICWDCIQNDRHEHHKPKIIVDETDEGLLEYVQSHDRTD